jgi:hypothetical protein
MPSKFPSTEHKCGSVASGVTMLNFGQGLYGPKVFGALWGPVDGPLSLAWLEAHDEKTLIQPLVSTNG